MIFFVGLHQPSDAHHTKRAFISVNRLSKRVSDFRVNEWILDSGAFTQVSTHGGFTMSIAEYSTQIKRWRRCGNMQRAVSQDWMCEPWIVERTGLSVAEHQRRTIERYDALHDLAGDIVMPVLQGYEVTDYVGHVRQYGDRLSRGMWVGVGSVCKRNSSPFNVAVILRAVLDVRPDLRLHGFGLKTTALRLASIRDRLYSADSMAWSYRARLEGRNRNDIQEALRFVDLIEHQTIQQSLIW